MYLLILSGKQSIEFDHKYVCFKRHVLKTRKEVALKTSEWVYSYKDIKGFVYRIQCYDLPEPTTIYIESKKGNNNYD